MIEFSPCNVCDWEFFYETVVKEDRYTLKTMKQRKICLEADNYSDVSSAGHNI